MINEIIDNVDIDYPLGVINYTYDQDYDFSFKKGDFIYVDDCKMHEYFKLYREMQFALRDKMLDHNLFKFVNSIGKIVSIKTTKRKHGKGKIIRKSFELKIEFVDNQILTLYHIHFLTKVN